jgi:hypothetical protein
MATIYCLLVSNGSLKTFNSYNRWESVGASTDLTSALITSKGFLYSNLNTAYTNIYLKYTQVQTFADGSIEYESEEITTTMNPSAIEDYTAADGTELLKLTVPSFTIKDGIAAGDYLVAYSADAGFVPLIQNVVFASATTHKASVGFNFDTIFNYNAPLKYRVQVNAKGYSGWSPLQNPYEKFNAIVNYSSLDMGPNSITIQVANEAETITNTLVVPNAITLENGLPSIVIITSDSNNFKVHFKVADPDSDNVQYKITMTNSKNTGGLLLSDWSALQPTAQDIIYYIDTTNVVVGETNVLKIEYKDEFGGSGSYIYTFNGQYRNLVFMSDAGEYYTTDKGVLLKILQFEKLMSGGQSEVKSIKIQNNNSVPITNLQLHMYYLNAIQGVKVLMSKNEIPFVGSEVLDFGTDVLNPGEFKTIYILVDTTAGADGLCKFEIDVTATSVV